MASAAVSRLVRSVKREAGGEVVKFRAFGIHTGRGK